jgi:arabinoxylan arabinofuranohydrolase
MAKMDTCLISFLKNSSGPKWLALLSLCAAALTVPACAQLKPGNAAGANPIIRDKFTADPAPLVVGDTLYLYVGHDEAQGDEMFTMRDWLVYSTRDMKTWTEHAPIMKAKDFKWATGDAWASQAIEKNGKFYFYAAVSHNDTHPGMAIAVAVSDKPTGPFVDARGSALVTNEMTPKGPHNWEDIDPTVFTDDDGTSWLAWGNGQCYIAKLKSNMIEIDGPIREITPPYFVEGPWLHKRGQLYYLSYASMDKATQGAEHVSYSTAPSIAGPWTYRGLLTGPAKNSFTIHPGIVQFKENWYLVLHNAALDIGDMKGAAGRRAVTVEHLQFNPDGTMKPVVQTELGVSVPAPR